MWQIPVREFRVRNLLALESGQLIETQWAHGEDMPLASGDVQLAWSEFEVVECATGGADHPAGLKRAAFSRQVLALSLKAGERGRKSQGATELEAWKSGKAGE
jgi:hypothetical protein